MDRNTNIMESSRAANVALRKESVDRNLAWHCISEDVSVALRKESVDRNHAEDISTRREASRSPQGERG